MDAALVVYVNVVMDAQLLLEAQREIPPGRGIVRGVAMNIAPVVQVQAAMGVGLQKQIIIWVELNTIMYIVSTDELNVPRIPS
jgi:hypothetical protein